jgi:hypothetical protein
MEEAAGRDQGGGGARLHRLGSDPDTTGAALAAWAAQRPELGLDGPEACVRCRSRRSSSVSSMVVER